MTNQARSEQRRSSQAKGGETGLPEIEAPRGACFQAAVPPRLRIHPGLEVDVHDMVHHAVLLRRDQDQLLLEVHGGDQLEGVQCGWRRAGDMAR